MYKSVSATAETVNLNCTIGWVLTKSLAKKRYLWFAIEVSVKYQLETTFDQ